MAGADRAQRRRAAPASGAAACTTPAPAEPRTCSPAVAGGGEHVAQAGQGEGELEQHRSVGVRRPAGRGLVDDRGRVAEESSYRLRTVGDALGPAAELHREGARARRPGRSTSTAHGTAWEWTTAWVSSWAASGVVDGRHHPALHVGQRVQPEDRLGDDGEGAEGPDHQLAEVVAGDVLHDPATRLGDHAVGADHGDADEQVAGGADQDPLRAGGVGGEGAADAGAGDGLLEDEALALLGDDVPAPR